MVFSISAKQAAAIITILATTAQGHIIMTKPVPFGFADESTKQSPMSDTGADFPCKFPAGFTPEEQAPEVLLAGPDANTMTLQGGATHGGGSCQISLTTDTVPTKDSKWQVIKSIEGGCPSDAAGNASEDPLGVLPEISYGIPEGMAPGQYTLAWTWMNKIGNREMYMNCAPVEIGGGAAKREVVKINKKRQSALPDMFVANIGNGCSTTEGTDVTFPDPGEVLVEGAGVTPGAPVGSCGAAGSAAPATPAATTDTATGTDDAPGAPVDPAASPVVSPVDPAASPVVAPVDPAVSPVAAPVDPVAAPVDPVAAPVDPVVAPVDPVAAPADPVAAPAARDPTDNAPASGAPCSPEGMFVCSADGTSFTRCASGVMSAATQMSAGTACTPGQDPTTLKMSVVKRAVRFGAEHVARSNEVAK